MKKWIRWHGLIAFICISVFLLLVWFVVVDTLTKRMIEKYGADIVGAKVELDNADVTLLPLGIKLNNLQITNPDAPMMNAIEIARVNFLIDGVNLARRKIIINEMVLDEVKINTRRKTSGAISKKAKTDEDGLKKKLDEKFSIPSLETFDVKEILAKENLRSVEIINSLNNDIKAEKAKWQETLKKLPNKEKFDGYKKRIDAIKQKSAQKGNIGDMLGGAGDAVSIKNDIETDLKQIQSAQKNFKEQLSSLKQRMDEAIKAPQEDIKYLKEKYALSPKSLGNVSRLIWGPKIGDWVDKAVFWYEKIKPMLERSNEDKKEGHKVVKPLRGNGINVVYKEKSPLPDFLIYLINASVNLQIGELAGNIKNITSDQNILQFPLTFNFSGDKLNGAQSVKIDGVLDHIIPTNSKDTIKLSLNEYQLQEINLSDQQALPMTLQKGILDLEINGEIKNGNIDLNLASAFTSAQFSSESKESDNLLTKSIKSALSSVSEFTLGAEITGTFADYETNITSDLDRVLKNAVGDIIKKQTADIGNKLKAGVLEKVKKPTEKLKENFGQLTPVENEMSGRLNQGNKLISDMGAKSGFGGFKLPF